MPTTRPAADTSFAAVNTGLGALTADRCDCGRSRATLVLAVTGATPWWGTALIALITAAAALGGTALTTWRQNKRARQEEWFRRVQWAEQLTASEDDDRSAAGYRALQILSDSELASDDDRRLLLGLANDTANQTAELSFQAEVDEIEFLTDTEDDNDTTEEAT